TVISMATALIVAMTGLYGIYQVRWNLNILTTKSTPFQLASLEYRETMQRVANEVIKMSTAVSREDIATTKKNADELLIELKHVSENIEKLGGSPAGDSDSIKQDINELYNIGVKSIDIDAKTTLAEKSLSMAVKHMADLLGEMDKMVRSLQLNYSASFMSLITSASDVQSIQQSSELVKANIATNVLSASSAIINLASEIETQ